MRFIVFIFIFSSYSTFAKVEAKISSKQIKTMSFIEIQNLRNAYLEFFKEINSSTKYSSNGEKKFSYIEDFLKEINKSISAYALDNGAMCFFGGWPSKMNDNYCQHPSRHSGDPQMKQLGEVYNRDNSCGQVNAFRCNPLLFGAPKNLETDEVNGIKVMTSPNNGLDKGYCVVIDTYGELTEKCEQVSEDSVADIIKDLQENPDKHAKLEELNNLILGDGGFCPQFSEDYKFEYDACDNLKNRLEKLLAEQEQNDEQTPQDKMGHQDTKYADAMSVLNQCEDYLPKVDSDDVFSRNITQKLRGGIISCRPQTTLPLGASDLTSGGLKDVAERFEKEGYLKQLNREKLKSQVLAYFAADKIINKKPDRERYLEEIKKHSSHIGNEPYLSDFNGLYEQFASVQSETEESVSTAIEKFNKKARDEDNSVQKVCKQIYDEFHEQKLDKRGGNRKKASQRNQKQKEFYTKANTFIKQKLDELQSQTDLGFLMGTDTFKDHISDTDYDFENFIGVDYGFGRECALKKNFQVVMPLTEDTLKKAVAEVKEEMFDEMEDMTSDDSIFLSLNIEKEIDEYLKYNPSAVLQTLLKADNQEEMAKYICHRVEQIYDADEMLEFGKIVGGSTLAAVGGLVCLVPIPGARVACAGMISTGVGMATNGAVEKGVDAYERGQGNQRAAMKGEFSFSEYINEKRVIDNQMNESITAGVLNVLPGVASVKGMAAGVNTGTQIAQRGAASSDEALKIAQQGAANTDETLKLAQQGTSPPAPLKLDPVSDTPFKQKPLTDTVQNDSLNHLFNPKPSSPPAVRNSTPSKVKTSDSSELAVTVRGTSSVDPRKAKQYRDMVDEMMKPQAGKPFNFPSPVDPRQLQRSTAAQIFMALPEKTKSEELKQKFNLPSLLREDKNKDFYQTIEQKLFDNQQLTDTETSEVQARLASYLGLSGNKINAELVEERVRQREEKLNLYTGDSTEKLILTQENYLLNLLFESLKKSQTDS